MNQQYRIGDQVVISKAGTITKVEWNPYRKQIMYSVNFDDGTERLAGDYGSALVTDSVIMAANGQRLTPREIKELKEGGILA